jgi:hypothetical protein
MDGTTVMVEAVADRVPRTLRWQDLQRAVAAGGIDAGRAEALWQFLSDRPGADLRPSSIWSMCCGTRAP